MKFLEDFLMMCENLQGKIGRAMSFFQEKIIFSSAPVSGINNDQFLSRKGANQAVCIQVHW